MIHAKTHNPDQISDSDIKYVDELITKASGKRREALCNLMFDILNTKGVLRDIFKSCDDELQSFRFSRMIPILEDIKFVEKGPPQISKDEEYVEFVVLNEEGEIEEDAETIRIPKSELEYYRKETRADDWIEGEMSICFWGIQKYLGLGLRGSFVEFLKVYLRREHFHFLLNWYYRELLGREAWLRFEAGRFDRDHSGFLKVHDSLSRSSKLSIKQKYDLDIITFVDLEAEKNFASYLSSQGVKATSSDLFTPGKKEYRLLIPVVIDANTIVSALAYYSNESYESVDIKIFRNYINRNILVVVSPEILEEYERKLKENIDRIVAKEIAFNWFEVIKKSSKVVLPSQRLELSRDPDDNKYFECAKEGEAKYILSWDKDILDVGEYEGIEPIKPGDFLKRYGSVLYPT